MPRQILTDEKWSKLRFILLGESIYDKPDLRLAVEEMLYRIRVGCPWRDLPRAFGPWNAVYKRFRAWCQSGKWWRVLEATISDPDLEWTFIDGTHAKAIGRSRAGLTSKVHMVVDAYGLPIDFEITGGQVADCTVAPDLIVRLSGAEAIVGDKGYDSESIREQIEDQGSQPAIPRRRHSTRGNEDLDHGLYRYRQLVENAFARLKQYRALASRFDKLKNMTRAWWPWLTCFYGCLCETATRPRAKFKT